MYTRWISNFAQEKACLNLEKSIENGKKGLKRSGMGSL
jgi:hypothetical protein